MTFNIANVLFPDFEKRDVADPREVMPWWRSTSTSPDTAHTYGGTFNSATHQYDKRTVVRAERIPDGAVPALPPAASGVTRP